MTSKFLKVSRQSSRSNVIHVLIESRAPTSEHEDTNTSSCSPNEKRILTYFFNDDVGCCTDEHKLIYISDSCQVLFGIKKCMELSDIVSTRVCSHTNTTLPIRLLNIPRVLHSHFQVLVWYVSVCTAAVYVHSISFISRQPRSDKICSFERAILDLFSISMQ